jgi:group I intron endonuclease
MHINKINGKKYIGQTGQKPEDRFRRDGIGYMGSRVFYNAIQKYGWDNFEHKILFSNLTLEQANTIEQTLISVYKTTDRKYGYNLESGGKNHIVAEETKRMLSEMQKGKNTGAKNPFYGQKHTEETRAKMRENHADMRGAKHPRAKFTEEDVKRIIDLMLNGVSTKDVAKMYGVSFACISGIRTHKNWSYLTKGIVFPHAKKE